MGTGRADEFEAALFRIAPSDYSGSYGGDLLEEYSLYVQTHEKVSQRREGANQFFVTLNSAIVAAVGLWREDRPSDLILIGACVAAIAICLYWRTALRSYQSLSSAKFEVIQAIERRLPLALYEAEWAALAAGKDPKVHRPLGQIERAIPLVFCAVYLLIIAAILVRAAPIWPWR